MRTDELVEELDRHAANCGNANHLQGLKWDIEQAAAEIRRLSGLVDEAREALRPFAEHADFYNDCEQHPGGCPDRSSLGEMTDDLVVGDLRRARATLAKLDATPDHAGE